MISAFIAWCNSACPASSDFTSSTTASSAATTGVASTTSTFPSNFLLANFAIFFLEVKITLNSEPNPVSAKITLIIKSIVNPTTPARLIISINANTRATKTVAKNAFTFEIFSGEQLILTAKLITKITFPKATNVINKFNNNNPYPTPYPVQNRPTIKTITTINSKIPVKNALKKSLMRRLALTSLNLGNPYKMNKAITKIIAISVPLSIK